MSVQKAGSVVIAICVLAAVMVAGSEAAKPFRCTGTFLTQRARSPRG